MDDHSLWFTGFKRPALSPNGNVETTPLSIGLEGEYHCILAAANPSVVVLGGFGGGIRLTFQRFEIPIKTKGPIWVPGIIP